MQIPIILDPHSNMRLAKIRKLLIGQQANSHYLTATTFREVGTSKILIYVMGL
jgi:hypothetical protein